MHARTCVRAAVRVTCLLSSRHVKDSEAFPSDLVDNNYATHATKAVHDHNPLHKV